jgi:hypothetical protein
MLSGTLEGFEGYFMFSRTGAERWGVGPLGLGQEPHSLTAEVLLEMAKPFFVIKSTAKSLRLSGARISGQDTKRPVPSPIAIICDESVTLPGN